MAKFLTVLWLIWCVGSLIGVPVFFIASYVVFSDEAKGACVLLFIVSILSMCGAIWVNPG